LIDDKCSGRFFFSYRDGVSGYTGNYRWLILRRRARLLFLTSGKRGSDSDGKQKNEHSDEWRAFHDLCLTEP